MLVIVILVEFAVIALVAVDREEPIVKTGIILACILAMVLIGSLLIGTHYTVDRGELKIISGPFRWKVSIDEITSVEPTRSPLSSPALSLDRLRIRYGKGRRVLVSPADKEGFLRAIGYDLKSETGPDS